MSRHGLWRRDPVHRRDRRHRQAATSRAEVWNAVVNKALDLLDGAVKSEGLIIVGATNRPVDIDEAIKRSGRLETHIEMPDVATLAEILAHHLGDDVTQLIQEPAPDVRSRDLSKFRSE